MSSPDKSAKITDEIGIFCNYDSDMIYSSSSSALPFFENSI